jgi:alkanesulfonate monooxygenase SsuD/methylene tetrahydromethanopterin reductase-like flavin-dependent oxidoreductase (luciferase family)
MGRLGIIAATSSGLSFSDLQGLAREAEAAGFEAIFANEFMNDALADCQVMAQATSRIRVGTSVANIYLRHSALCAQTAVAIDDTSKGRFILGLGVSHRPIVEGVYKTKMERPRDFLREYVTTVRNIVIGKGYPGAPVPPRAATYSVPIYIAAVAPGTIELAGELADGVMLTLYPRDLLPNVQAALQEGAARAGRNLSAVDVAIVVFASISEDPKAARDAAKKNLAFLGRLPFYNKLLQNSGFEQEAAALASGDVQGVSDRMTEELSLVGPPGRCREQLAAFRAAGVQLPIVMPVPVAGQTYAQAVRQAMETFT